MTAGDLPPSSNDTSLRLDAAAAAETNRPVLVEPVKEIFRIFMCEASNAPVDPAPETMLTIPRGNPAEEASPAINAAASGDFSDDFKIIALPAAVEHPILEISMINGTFQGINPGEEQRRQRGFDDTGISDMPATTP